MSETSVEYIPQSRIADICAGSYDALIPAWSTAKKGGAIRRGELYYPWPAHEKFTEGWGSLASGSTEFGISPASVKTMFQSGMLALVPASGIFNPVLGETRSTRALIENFCRDYGFTPQDLACTAQGLEEAPVIHQAETTIRAPQTPDELAAAFKNGGAGTRGA